MQIELIKKIGWIHHIKEVCGFFLKGERKHAKT
jgi:hypothetical protein